ncbi:MAG: beta-N-acetylhexosaminidase [Acholeplasmataceae bacterium]|jgi:beta-N-acetylhexosaminidase|nr:beta-N-acetylhexosaminidase [Acholeplasmataceae bacterium]
MIKSIADLTLEEKLGQLIVFGFYGDEYSSEIEKMIKDYKLGNVILFARNISSPEKLFNLNKTIQQKMLEHLKLPAFIAIDQEGGMVTRLFNQTTVFPGAMTTSASDNLKNAYQIGQYMAIEMAALGINLNFAPVLDVNTNPLNPGIGVRSYGDNPSLVSEYGKAYLKGIQTKLFATAKHFPGKGEASVDSHLDLPKVDLDLKRIKEVELQPFKTAIENGIKAVMTAHAIYPELDNKFPATLSKPILTDLLRTELNFVGLIVTDGMEMQAIDNHFGAVDAAVDALLAGANLILYCHYPEQQIAAVKVLKEAVLSGRIREEVLNERVERILKYKNELNLANLAKQYLDVKKNVGKIEHQRFAQNVVDNALTLVKGEVFKKDNKTLFIAQFPEAITLVESKGEKQNLTKVLQQEIPDFDYRTAKLNPSDEEIAEFVKTAKNYEQTIITTYNANMYSKQITLIKELLNQNLEVHVISLRNPFDLHLLPEIKNYVCLYEYTKNSINTLKNYLLGNLIPQGKLPVKLNN